MKSSVCQYNLVCFNVLYCKVCVLTNMFNQVFVLYIFKFYVIKEA